MTLSRHSRAGTAVCAVGALAACAAAWAATITVYVTPTLMVTQTGSVTTIVASVASTDDGTARLALYPPPGTAVTTSHAPGTILGRATVTMHALDLGGSPIPFSGTVLVAPAGTTPAAQPACLGGQAPLATWLIVARALARTVEVPLYAVPTGESPDAALPDVKLVVCFPPAEVPVGTPGRALFGGKLATAALVLVDAVAPASSGAWLAAWTPFAGATPAEEATVVSPAVAAPGAVTLAVTAARGDIVATGTVVQAGRPRADGRAALLAGAKPTSLRRVAVAPVRPDGTFSLRTTLTARFFQVRAIARPRRADAPCSSPLPVPCLNATLTGFAARSPIVAAAPRS